MRIEPGQRSRTGAFFHLSPAEMATFTAKDFAILESRYRMKRWFYRGRLRGLADRLVIWLLVLATDFNVSWFGYHQAYWAVRYSKVLGKKSLVVLGGFDVCEEEDANLPRRFEEIRYILRNADRLVAVSHRVRDKARSIDPGARVDVIYHGFDAERFRASGPKGNIAVTVAYVSRENVRRKGLDTFVRAAALLPELKFVVVGGWLDEGIERLRSMATKNVSFPGRLSERDLVRTLQESAIYVQASTHEGFGCSLAEAMLCGCVPVVTDRGAIPEVVGDTGIYVEVGDSSDLARGIREGLRCPDIGVRARERIASKFDLETRRRALLEAVEGMLR